jgi:hypothetical protein
MDAARDASSSHSATGAEKQAATLSQPHAVLHASSDSIEPRKPSPFHPSTITPFTDCTTFYCWTRYSKRNLVRFPDVHRLSPYVGGHVKT